MLSAQLDMERRVIKLSERERYIYIVDVHLYMHAPLLLKKEMFV